MQSAAPSNYPNSVVYLRRKQPLAEDDVIPSLALFSNSSLSRNSLWRLWVSNPEPYAWEPARWTSRPRCPPEEPLSESLSIRPAAPSRLEAFIRAIWRKRKRLRNAALWFFVISGAGATEKRRFLEASTSSLYNGRSFMELLPHPCLTSIVSERALLFLLLAIDACSLTLPSRKKQQKACCIINYITR